MHYVMIFTRDNYVIQVNTHFRLRNRCLDRNNYCNQVDMYLN